MVTQEKHYLSYVDEPYEPEANEEYMNDKQLSHFMKLLNAWKEDLLKGGDDTITALQDTKVPPDVSDQASQEEAFALSLRKRDRERKVIDKIDSAVKKIHNKDYGYCEECGIEIGIRRLEARPTATLCIDCKTIDEVREKQRR